MSESPVGTTTQKYLSTRQKMTIGAVWLIGLIIFFMIFGLPPNDKNQRPIFILLPLTGLIVVFFTSIVMDNPTGKPYIKIIAPEGLSGEFSVRQHWPLWLVCSAPFFIFFLAEGISDHKPPTPLFIFVSAFTFLSVSIYGLAFMGVFNPVTALRIDDKGQIFFRHHNENWKQLLITDYEEVVCRFGLTRQSMECIEMLFFEPNSNTKAISIPLTWIRSKYYNSLVSGEVVSEFFWIKCDEARYRMDTKALKWQAVRRKTRGS